MNPPQVSSENLSLMWLYSNIDKCKTVATGTRMFMLLFIGTLLCPNLGSTVSLHYLWSLRDINRIKYYDWGSMAYAILLHFMTQLSHSSLSSLRGEPFVWQVKFKFFVGFILQRLFVLLLAIVYFCRFGCMNILEFSHSFWKTLLMNFQGSCVGYPRTTFQHFQSAPWRLGKWWLIA